MLSTSHRLHERILSRTVTFRRLHLLAFLAVAGSTPPPRIHVTVEPLKSWGPLRPGVARIVREALDAGTQVAVCSTSNERAVSKIVEVLLGPDVAKVMPVFAGDMVPRKKPDPAIYQLAAQELNLDPAHCVVIEDSRIGMQAAKGAGMRCVVTKSSYTQSENFDVADAVVDCIGDTGDERFSLGDLVGADSLWS